MCHISPPSCVDGAGLIPFPLYLRRVKVKAQSGKHLPMTQTHATGTWAPSGTGMSWLSGKRSHACLVSKGVGLHSRDLCAHCIKLHLNCKMKTRPSSWRQLEGKETAWESETRVVTTPSELLGDSLFDPSALQCGQVYSGCLWLESSRGWRWREEATHCQAASFRAFLFI